MSAVAARTPTLEPAINDGVQSASSHAVLDSLEQPDITLALWTRPLPDAIAQGLDATASQALPELDHEGQPDEVIARAEAAIARSGLACRQTKSWLLADIDGLVHRLGRVAGYGHVHARLMCVTRDACRYFHVDAVPMRLMCSYLGPGTQWVAPSVAGPECIGPSGTERLLADREVIQQVQTGAVAVFRGRTGPRHTRPLVHRSPPIEATRTRRFVLNVTAVARQP